MYSLCQNSFDRGRDQARFGNGTVSAVGLLIYSRLSLLQKKKQTVKWKSRYYTWAHKYNLYRKCGGNAFRGQNNMSELILCRLAARTGTNGTEQRAVMQLHCDIYSEKSIS